VKLAIGSGDAIRSTLRYLEYMRSILAEREIA